ncbi:MAG: SpoIIE family protein phosphatase [Bacteroidota bacterium]
MFYVIIVILVSAMLIVLTVTWNTYLSQRHLEERVKVLDKDKSNYESIIEQANDALFVIDIANGNILQCNPAAADLLGYTKAQLEEKTLFDIQPREMLEASSSIVADVWEKKGMIFKNIPFITATGEHLPVECSAKVAPFAGRPAIVIYARDIRERLRLEGEILKQKAIIEEKNKDITDSIEYAKRLQRSVFLEKELLKKLAPDSFIFFKPRDIVSGDFYWFTHFTLTGDITNSDRSRTAAGTDLLVVAAADCTGHGVPGAFMSIIGNTLLNQTINNPDITSPAQALDHVNEELKKMLSQKKDEAPIRDGMDISLCVIDFQNKRLNYAGANNPLFIVRGKAVIELKADKQPITASSEIEARPFTDQTFDLQAGDSIYLFTDGYADQFGGPKGKKFMYKRFEETLINMQDNTMEEQKGILYYTFENWRGNLAQVDDVLVIGIRV